MDGTYRLIGYRGAVGLAAQGTCRGQVGGFRLLLVKIGVCAPMRFLVSSNLWIRHHVEEFAVNRFYQFPLAFL